MSNFIKYKFLYLWKHFIGPNNHLWNEYTYAEKDPEIFNKSRNLLQNYKFEDIISGVAKGTQGGWRPPPPVPGLGKYKNKIRN